MSTPSGSANASSATGNIFSNLNNEIMKLLELIPCFDGDIKTLSNFISTVDEIIVLVNQTNPSEITKKLVILTLKNKIKGKAAQCLSITTINSWRELKEHLLQNYSDTRSEHTLMYEISHFKQNKESIFEYFSKFDELFLIYKNKIECKYEGNVSKIVISNAVKYFTQCFINNCKDPYRSQLSARNPQMLSEILNLITNDLQYIHNQHISNTQTQKYTPPKNQIQFNQRYQSPMHKYPPFQQQSRPFAPSANVRNSQQKPSPMSIQTRQFPNQNQPRQEQLFNQNLENDSDILVTNSENDEIEHEIEIDNENRNENHFLELSNDQLESNL